MNIRLFKPSVSNEELENIKEVFSKAWLGLGPKVNQLEKEWSNYIGCKESIGVNSCTAALHLALSAFKFTPGKKVLVPVITFASTAMAILYNNLEPVFVDVDPDNISICLNDLEQKYDKDCVAIIPVHFGGHPVQMQELMRWAKSKNLKVIEDCAHTAGGEYNNKKLGTWGDIGCFSFEEKKCMTSGDGGMICSDDVELIAPLKHSRWIGINKDTWQRLEENSSNSNINDLHWYYEINDIGYKYNMNDLSAAIALAQLKKLNLFNEKRRVILNKYINGIKNNTKVRIGLPYKLENSSYWLFMVRVENRDSFILHMKKYGISTGVHYMPLTKHPLFHRYSSLCPVANQIWEEFVTLPLFPDLKEEEVDYIINYINNY